MTQIYKRASDSAAVADPPAAESGVDSGSDACCPDLEELVPPDLFRALSDPNRISLLAELCERGDPCTVSEAAGCCPVDLSVVSRHLTTLRQAGVVRAEKRGRAVYYTVDYERVSGLLRSIADAIDAWGATAATPPADPEEGEPT